MRLSDHRIRTWIAGRPLVAVAVLAAAVLVAAALMAQTSLSDLWIRFPDGTVQTTAAHNCFNPADPDDVMIRVGGVCIDVYEASVWSQPAGGIQYGVADDDYPCSDNGQDCFGLIYARSVPGVQPSASITWFQAQQALANSGKRLPTNAEWQMAVAGTPDDTGDGTTPCNTRTGSIQNTGAEPDCISHWGAFDMVGNAWEWVADWVPASNACPDWGAFSDDTMCLSGASTTATAPGALVLGSNFVDGSKAGPFAVLGGFRPSNSDSTFGFRGAR